MTSWAYRKVDVELQHGGNWEDMRLVNAHEIGGSGFTAKVIARDEDEESTEVSSCS
jgi:hypothetical protein